MSAWLKTTDGSTKTIMGFTATAATPLTLTVTGTWTRLGATRNSATAENIQILLIKGTTSDTADLLIWHPDARSTTQGVGLPAYQRVNTSTDYDSTGFPVYIKPNGSNQFMQTNSINFSSTDKMTVWQGVRKLSDAAGYGVVAELSISYSGNSGTFVLTAPAGATTGTYLFGLRGTTVVGYEPTGFAAPRTNVLTASFDIAGAATATEVFPRINGVLSQVGPVGGADAGTGNFGNYPAYFYMRAGSSLAFNGNDYGSIARGAASTAAQIASGETYINNLTKAYTP
jgi:hypothetical protein